MFAFTETGTSKISRLLYYAILGYITALFLPNFPVLVNLLMAFLFVMAWVNIANSNKQISRSFSENSINIGLMLFVVLQFVSVLFSSDKATGFDILQLRLPLFIVPLAFCFIDFEQSTWRKILAFYSMVAVIASVAGFVYGVCQAVINHNSGYLYNDNISWLLLGKQAAYFSFYINAAIFAVIYLLSYKSEQGKSYRVMLYGSLVWLIFFSYMLASTMSTISLALILLSIIIIQIIHKKKFLLGAILVVGCVIGVFLLNEIFPKSLVRFQRLTHTSYRFDNTGPENHFDAAYNANEWSSASTRLALWQCGYEIWQQHPIIGTGLGDIRNALKEKYTEKQFWFALNTRRNLHSQYLDILVSMGIVGLLVFITAFFIYPIRIFIVQKQTLALCVFICLALCLLTENMFDRYQGEVLIAFVLPLSAKLKIEN